MKNLILDWSGVVRDTVHRQLWIVNRIFEVYGVGTITLDEFREQWEQPYIHFYKKYLPKGFVEEERRKIYREVMSHEDCPPSSIFPQMGTLIRQWKKSGAFLAVVSSDFADSLHAEIKEWELDNCFQMIATDIEDKLETIQKILEAKALDPSDTYFVGDSNHEIDVAKKAGIHSIAVTWGFTSEQKLSARKPDYIVHNVQELDKAISL